MNRFIIAMAGVAMLAGCSGSEDAGASAGEAASAGPVQTTNSKFKALSPKPTSQTSTGWPSPSMVPSIEAAAAKPASRTRSLSLP